MTATRRAVVLLSGGLESSTCLAEALAAGFVPHALTVRYGQRHQIEVERAAAVAAHLGVTCHRVVALDLAAIGGSALTDLSLAVPRDRDPAVMARDVPATYVPARNTMFLALALGWAEVLEATDLFIGANAVDYSGYVDCRAEFLRAFERLAAVATQAGVDGARFRVHAPLLQMTKAQIVRRAMELGVPLEKTWTCYEPQDDSRPCGRCDACRLRQRGFAEAGLTDPLMT